MIKFLSDIASAIFLFPVIFYQHTLGRLLPRTCRFAPTCSQYMKAAVRKYGIIRGFLLGITRIARCNPMFSGGYDPA